MPPVAKPAEISTPPTAASRRTPAVPEQSESLFERFAWIYIFCREHVFRDDTARIIQTLWPDKRPSAETRVMELGCGPGFYARNIAAQFPGISVTGIDRSRRQLEFASAKSCRVGNCRFERDNVLNLRQPDESFSEVIASRLFTVLPERERAVAEIFRVLRPQGRFLVAEPRYAFSASIPLLSMRFLARLSGYFGTYREPTQATALSFDDFARLFRSQPWASVRTWQVGRYQYALCVKD